MEVAAFKHMAEYALQDAGQGADYLGQTLADLAKAKGQTPEGMRAAAREFEAYFIANLMRIMRETVHEGLIENKAGKNFYYFYDMEIGRLSAQAGGIGLARMVEQYAREGGLVKDDPLPSSSLSDLPIRTTNRQTP